MRLNVALATVALALVGAASAHAADISVVLDNPTQTFTGTEPLSFSGTIYNNGTSDIVLVGDSIAVPSQVTATDYFSDLGLTDLPITLTPGGSYHSDPFFDLSGIAGNVPFTGTFTVFDDAGTGYSADFSVVGAAVPEPGSMALLASGMMGGGLFLARRRRR